MQNSPDSDRDLRKEIAADAAEPEETPSIFVRAGQFFLVPLVIVTACVAVYAFFRYMAAGPGQPPNLLTDSRSGGAASRKHASLQLAQILQEQYQKKQLDPQMFEPLLSLFNDLPANEAPADAITLKLVG